MTGSNNPRWLPRLALCAGVLCISCSAIFVKRAAVPGTTSAFYRLAFALAGMLPLLLFRRIRLPGRAALVMIAIGGIAFATELTMWQVALRTTTAANATLLINLAPVWVGLGAAMFLREPQGRAFWIGTALAMIGMAVVALRGSATWHGLSSGDALATVASVFYAGYTLVSRHQRRTLDTITFLILSTTASTCASFIGCLVLRAPLSGFAHNPWPNLLAVGLVSHLLGYLAISYAIGHIQAPRVAVVLLAQPILTAVLAHLWLAEPLTASFAIGGAIALCGLALALAPRSPAQALRAREDFA